MPNEIGPLAPIRAPQRIAVERREPGPPTARAPAGQSALPAGTGAGPAGQAALAAAPPIDAERVSQIRAAIADGSYPLVPTRIADAMIAAGLLLSLGE